MIHYISPFRSDKNIGKALNDAIEQLNPAEDDWICHMDQDAMWLLPDSKAQLEEILSSTKYDVLGPKTNRLGSSTQLVRLWQGEEVFDNTDLLYHLDIAKGLWVMNRNGICPLEDGVLAAFCICFRVSTWRKVGRFHENNLAFDWLFSEIARKQGFKLGIMSGLYIFHLYRTGRDKGDYSHLI